MNLSVYKRAFGVTSLALGVLFCTSASFADTYEVTIKNVTAGQAFTPRLAITHTEGKIFMLGEPAIEELAIIAEGGDIAPMMAVLEGFGDVVTDMQVGAGLLMPGASETITIEGNPGSSFSLLNMLIPTNDAFIGVNAIALPESGSITYRATVYDAGSEINDELCSNIPGPVCGGEGGSPGEDGEGYIYVHSGIHGIGDLAAETYDWNNPAAIITITKI
ncbi:MAG: hypothetical protein COA96_05115 [SAR86 cluster bacterium]|uniref:Spondin domain-containing protein n=1 Tax=SAR86 cluster bacterium TaxID=2030880 RepID=A0A2A5B4I4_9GAMM|nr:MAG: hypothetical protein COA96_05115 [SAR86 cluster bacterium]